MNVNTFKTGILLAGLGGLFILFGRLLLDGAGAFIGLMLAFAIVGWSYWNSAKLALRAAGAQPVSEQQMPEYYRIVRELAQAGDIPMPSPYVAASMQPNAFATGRNPKNAAVAVTEGILQVLDWDELKGVLAHEISHVKNRDILISSVAAAIAVAISYLANMAQFAAIFGVGRSDDDDGPGFLQLILLAILAPMAAMIMQLALSRSREFDADRTGARLVQDGEALARALEKIDNYAKQVPMKIDPAHAQAYIINPFTGHSVNFAGLFKSHPPTAERVARLRSREWAE